MEPSRHDTSYCDEDVYPVGNYENQSYQAPLGHSWASNTYSEIMPQISAPPPPQASHYGFSALGSGSFEDYPSGSHPPNNNGHLQGDIRSPHPLDKLYGYGYSQDTGDSGICMLPQPSVQEAPISNLASQRPYQSFALQYDPNGYMPSVPGDDSHRTGSSGDAPNNRPLDQIVPPTSGRKRPLETQTGNNDGLTEFAQPSRKVLRVDENLLSYSHTTHRSDNVTEPLSGHPTLHAATSALDDKQKKFIRNWFEDFAEGQDDPFLASEEINALATLLKARPQPILDYINLEYISSALQTSDHSAFPVSARPQARGERRLSLRASLAESNGHLPSEILAQVEKYVKSAHQRRAQGDGRRSVNDGPFHCTFKNCGYKTARAFDWRRHEETHEPQELWLCHFCHQNGDQNPFLVSRRDKFLRHARNSHKGRDPELVLEMSKIEFRADFDPKCPFCFKMSKTWDDRCKHILAHFEDEEHRRSQGVSNQSTSLGEHQQTSEGDASEYFEHRGSNESADDEDHDDSGGGGDDEDDEDDENDDDDLSHFQYDSSRRDDPTGGAGGGSGAFGSSAAFRNRMTGDGGGLSGDNGSYHYYSDTGYSMSHPGADYSDLIVEELPAAARRRKAVIRSSAFRARVYQGRGWQGWSKDASKYASRMDVHGSKYSSPPYFPSRSPLQPRGALPGPNLAILGHGSHGFVDTVQNHKTGKIYARKISRHLAFPREVEILKRLTHPHIIKFVAAYTQNSWLNLIMSPVADATVHDWLGRSDGPLGSMRQVHTWIGCLSSGLSYIHSQRIRHADIKPQNLLVRGAEIFITDFGISRVVSETDSESSSISPSTPQYAPLEIAENRVHGRKADIFSLGCVVLEMLTRAQGKSLQELHQHLGFPRDKSSAHRDTYAYYKSYDKLLSWICVMRHQATAKTKRLWDICEWMLQNRSEQRPSAILLLEEVRQILETDELASCACSLGPTLPQNLQKGCVPSSFAIFPPSLTPDSDIEQKQAAQPDSILEEYAHSHNKTLSKMTTAEKPFQVQWLSQSCLARSGHGPSNSPCVCIARKEGYSVLYGLRDILNEYQMDPDEVFATGLKLSNMVSSVLALPCPPAYEEDSSLYAVYESVYGVQTPSQPCGIGYAAEVRDQKGIGKIGTQSFQKTSHETGSTSPPCALAPLSCHRCSTRFSAPRLDQCRRCSHIRCEECTSVRLAPSSRSLRKADVELAAIGSHLLPPAYSRHDKCVDIPAGLPSTDLQTENTVLGLVLSQSTGLGNKPGERFIEDCPSTFDRISRSSQENLHQRNFFSFTVDSQLQSRPLITVIPPSNTSSRPTSPLSDEPPCTRFRDDHSKSYRLSLPKSRLFMPGWSKQAGPSKQQQAMNDQHNTNELGTGHLKFQTPRHHKSRSNSNNGVDFSRLPRMSRSRTTSTESSAVLSGLPLFRKSHTTSTTGSNEVSRLQVMHTFPLSTSHREALRARQGEHTKASRRASNESSRSQKDFQYYGRHANSWLFNDWSVTNSVKKGFGKVFSKRDEEA